ncbi:MAG TPA: hypothetical protein VGS80_06735 [Ktedonobacterales bacterium]|nr:hypothetical protein [Ktedonobacterales bacterium]
MPRSPASTTAYLLDPCHIVRSPSNPRSSLHGPSLFSTSLAVRTAACSQLRLHLLRLHLLRLHLLRGE